MFTISVVIPVFNRANVIRRALDSVLAQTLPPHEIIVVDDGSTDGTADIVAAHYPSVTLIRQTNQGQPVARNVGIARATGDLIALLDSDDCWLPEKLRLQAEVFTQNPQLGLVATQKYKNLAKKPVIEKSTPKLHYYRFNAFLKRTWLHPSSVMIPRRVIAETGGFDPALSAAEDWDMWIRIAYRYPVARLELPLTMVYKMEDSISRNRPKLYANDIKVIAKWNPTSPKTFDRDRRLRPAYYYRQVFSFAWSRGMRLYRYGGTKCVAEFLRQLDEAISLPALYRTPLHLYFKLLPKK